MIIGLFLNVRIQCIGFSFDYHVWLLSRTIDFEWVCVCLSRFTWIALQNVNAVLNFRFFPFYHFQSTFNGVQVFVCGIYIFKWNNSIRYLVYFNLHVCKFIECTHSKFVSIIQMTFKLTLPLSLLYRVCSNIRGSSERERGRQRDRE